MSPRIAFLAPGLEPGANGVGDYCRVIADEFRRMGWSVGLVSLNDRCVDRVTVSDTQCILRLPESKPWAIRSRQFSEFLNEKRFDVISLQWVGFGFEKRGLPWYLVEAIARARRQCLLHLNFHEIWLGEKPGLRRSHRMLGQMQKLFTLIAKKRWSPDIVHTTNGLYRDVLSRSGIVADVIPLPANFPVFEPGDVSAISKELRTQLDRDALKIVLFCSVDPEWIPDRFVALLRSAGSKMKKKIVLISLGNPGGGAGIMDTISAQLANDSNVSFCALGKQSAETISAVLRMADLGAITKSVQLLGKSGSFAALADHGLPVLIVYDQEESRRYKGRDDWRVPMFVIEEQNDLEDRFIGFVGECRKVEPRSSLPSIARQISESVSERLPH